MCRCLSGKLHIDFSLPGWLGNEMNAMIYGQFPGGNDSFRYFVCFVLLFRLYFQLSLSVCNFDATSDSKAQHENLFGSHLSSADTYSHAHTHTTASPPHSHTHCHCHGRSTWNIINSSGGACNILSN